MALFPARPLSSTIAVNRNAQFKPHRDSGAGAGQGISAIVGLGDYTGGELCVETLDLERVEVHDIRYSPLLFHGWRQKHWTLPFQGERFSIVWFTPQGCENWQNQQHQQQHGAQQDAANLAASAQSSDAAHTQ